MKEVREHIREVLNHCEISLKENNREYEDSNLNHRDVSDSYFVLCENFPIEVDDNLLTENTGPTLKLFVSNPKNKTDVRDDAISKARTICSSIVNPKFFKDSISRVSTSGFTVSRLQGNKDIEEININLSYEISFSIR